MANDNLDNLDMGRLARVDVEEVKSMGRKGGKASGEARKRKREFRKTFEILLDMPLKGGKVADAETIRNFAALKGRNITVQEAITIAMIQKAMKGDVRAAEFVRDTVGDKPRDNLSIEGHVPVVIVDDLAE